MLNTACSDYWGAIPDTQLCVDTNNGLNTPCFVSFIFANNKTLYDFAFLNDVFEQYIQSYL
jgi:hypothetical protein